MTATRLHRRHLLRGAGSIAVALPFLDVMSPRRARAQDAARKRFLVVVTPNGTLPDLWFPTGTESDFQLNKINDVFERHKPDLIAFKGVDNKAGAASVAGGGHAAQGVLLTARKLAGSATSPTGGGVSLDQEIASLWAKDPRTRTPYRSLELGTNNGNQGVYGSLAYAGPGMPLPKIGVAKTLFDRLFAGGSPEAEKLRQRRMSILDRVRGDYTRLQAKLGADDKQRLESHVESIREIEQRLAGNKTCGGAQLAAGTTTDSDKKLPDMFQEMLAVWTLALSCDMTRVVTYMFRAEGQTGGSPTFPWLGIGPEGNVYGTDNRDDKFGTQHHTMSHYDSVPEVKDRLLKANRWFMEQIATLVDKLKETPDGPGRTLFDGTTLLYGSAIGRGSHTMKDIPFLLFSRGNPAFKTGRFLNFAQRASHTDLLTAILHGMGSDTPVFGDAQFSQGTMSLA